MSQAGHDESHRMQDKEIRERLSQIQNKILVMSGKGGVGKSSVAAYLAVGLAKRGHKVGLMDVDLHGPSIPHLLDLKGSIGPGTREGKASPIRYMPNLEVMSIEPLMGDDKNRATIWRGPLKIGVIRQFISDIEWEDLDYLIIDSPPGTGDEPLTVAQTIPDARALIVTTPQELSLADVRKSINFCRHVHMEILGLVENMSGMVCPHCQKTIDLFKTRGGMLMAKQEGVVLLGTLPLQPEVIDEADRGSVAFLDNHDLAFTRELNKVLDHLEKSERKTVPSFVKPGDVPASVPGKEEVSGRLIAIPIADGKLASHFGHCQEFAFVETEDGKIRNKFMRTPPPHEPGVLPRWLKEQGAEVVIAGGMGERAQEMLKESGMEVITGAPADAPESLVNQYLSKSLVTGENVCHH